MTSTALDLPDLASVNGGMNTEGWRQSTNIEDRRGMSLEDSMKVAWPQPEPLPPLVRTPGDLPSQLGLDDIGKNFGGGGDSGGGNFGS